MFPESQVCIHQVGHQRKQQGLPPIVSYFSLHWQVASLSEPRLAGSRVVGWQLQCIQHLRHKHILNYSIFNEDLILHTWDLQKQRQSNMSTYNQACCTNHRNINTHHNLTTLSSSNNNQFLCAPFKPNDMADKATDTPKLSWNHVFLQCRFADVQGSREACSEHLNDELFSGLMLGCLYGLWVSLGNTGTRWLFIEETHYEIQSQSDLITQSHLATSNPWDTNCDVHSLLWVGQHTPMTALHNMPLCPRLQWDG